MSRNVTKTKKKPAKKASSSKKPAKKGHRRAPAAVSNIPFIIPPAAAGQSSADSSAHTSSGTSAEGSGSMVIDGEESLGGLESRDNWSPPRAEGDPFVFGAVQVPVEEVYDFEDLQQVRYCGQTQCAWCQ